MLHDIDIILGLLVLVVALAWAAGRLKIAYPIFLVLGGLGIGFIPGLPTIQLRPDLVFVIFLPPLLYYAGILTTWRDFKSNISQISLLAVGLVLFTTVLVAVAARAMIPGLSWAEGFILGAIVSPPDAIAATSVLQRFRLPHRIITILEGESLINDATALVTYRLAVAVVIGGTFSFANAGGWFLLAPLGGIAVGMLAGILVAWVRPRIRESSIETAVSLLTPFVAYLPAEWMGLSSVLAVVTTGLYMGRKLPKITSAGTRLRSFAIWDTLVFLLNGIIFILIGLQLPQILATSALSIWELCGYTAIVSGICILARIVWVFPAMYISRLLLPKPKRRDPAPAAGVVFLISWTGMRGIVSLAAALALPMAVEHRAPIIFITFGVILATLVLQGLTLAPLIRFLKLSVDHDHHIEESTARYLAALAAIERLDQLATEAGDGVGFVARRRAEYEDRIAYYIRDLSRADESDIGGPDALDLACDANSRIVRESLAAERRMIVKLRDDGVIGDETLRRVQKDLDLEESRILAEE